MDRLADNATVEGSLLQGAAQGAEAVRAIVGTIRSFYEDQQITFAGPYGDNCWIEDYTVRVDGEPIGAVILVAFNDDGNAQHISANYRPRKSLLRLSRLAGEKLADTEYAKYFLDS
jgi:hypothetical protein